MIEIGSITINAVHTHKQLVLPIHFDGESLCRFIANDDGWIFDYDTALLNTYNLREVEEFSNMKIPPNLIAHAKDPFDETYMVLYTKEFVFDRASRVIKSSGSKLVVVEPNTMQPIPMELL